VVLRVSCLVLIPLSLMLLLAPGADAQTSFVAFESGHVRPIAMSPDGSRVFAVNTPDNRVFDNTGGSLTHVDSIPVGMEPVTVAARTNDEIWVVNHLSDSISIIDMAATPPQVVRTLLVGDEPRDLVFAGTSGNRAFITTAHRGQQRTHSSIGGVTGAGDPQLTTEGVGRADVWVFDATSLGATIGGTPIEILTFFADTPRGLAVTPDGGTVYVASHFSGNRTTAITETSVPDGFAAAGPSGGAPGGVLAPDDNAAGDPAPEVGIIVKFDGAAWRDTDTRDWSAVLNFDLPDHDVFSINANTLAPGSVVEYDGVGTTLFNVVVNPVSGKVYVTNTESPNHVRFEGPGDHGNSTVQGHLSESRVTVLDPAGPSVDPQHLNQHIDYAQLHTDPGADHAAIDAQIAHSLATPLQPVVSSDGATLYVPAFGSGKIGVFDTVDIEDSAFEANFDPTVKSAAYISTAGGPSGLVLDEANGVLFVVTRFDNSVAVIDLTLKSTLEAHVLHNPEPPSITVGRPFLYDAILTSGNGEASCSSCHVFGDLDHIGWDLGDPDGFSSTNNQPSATILPAGTTFHPMKGPMTTQTLRGLATHGGMHWRGDRVDGFFGTDPCSGSPSSFAPCDEDRSFRNFIVAFEGLVGKEGTITTGEVQQFADFMLQVMLPPNPVRALDNSLSSAEQDGADLFDSFEETPGNTPPTTDTIATCAGCHRLDPAQGFFGTGGEQSSEGEPQTAKVPHMRNLYAKIGMFGSSAGGGALGDQVRGFGFLHDGSVGSVDEFLKAPVFSLNNAQVADLEAYSLAFPTDLAPIVGQQVTLTSSNSGVVGPRIDMMIARAATSFDSLVLGGTVTECDLVVKGSVGGIERGWVRESGGLFRDDLNATIAGGALRALATSEGPLTYTCAPPGSGERMGIERDGDLVFDGLDNCPGAANGLQENFDGDVEGDACDLDDDNDALSDLDEALHGTDPFDEDSDDDGLLDGAEVLAGSDPLDPDDPGAAAVPMLPLWGFGALAAGMLAVGRTSLASARRQAR